MSSLPLKRITLPAFVALALATPAVAVAQEPAPTGAPLKATVELESAQLQVPPEAYGLACFTFPDCSLSGVSELATEGEAPVSFQSGAGATIGEGPLEYTETDGTVGRTIGCSIPPGDPVRSEIELLDGVAGELGIADVRNTPGANTIAVTLDPAGLGGESLPRELVERTEGGCGVTPEDHTLDMTVWWANFTAAHQDELDFENGGFVMDGLAWNNDDEAFVKTYQRPVNAGGFGVTPYTYQERTRVEVKPEYCPGPLGRIQSATANGQSLGINGMRFYPGQVVSAPPGSRLNFADGSVVELDKGGSWKVDYCAEKDTVFELPTSIKKIWIEVKKSLSGSDRKFEVRTDRAAAGVRGTKYQISYNDRKQLTRVAVKEGKVNLKGINGAKGRIMIRPGQVGIQKGKSKPKLVKR
jgi:hypothetical protein